MNVQQYINMSTALIVFIGGMLIVFVYPGFLEGHIRVLIGLFVLFYFAFRMGNSIMVIRRERKQKQGHLADLIDHEKREPKEPKSS